MDRSATTNPASIWTRVEHQSDADGVRRGLVLENARLFGRADLVAVGAEHAAVTLAWAERFITAGAAIEVLAGVVGHQLAGCDPAKRASEDRFEHRHDRPRPLRGKKLSTPE